jgi:hypothetical protein
MSQFGVFNLLDEDTILAIQAEAVSLVLQGKTVMQWSGEGTEATKKFAMNPVDVLEECNFSLKQLNPDTYGNLIKIVKPYHA